MRKRLLSLFVAMVFVISCISISSLAAETESEASADETNSLADDNAGANGEEYSVSVILKTTASEYWQYVQAGANAYMEAYPNITVEVKGATSETAYDEQQNIVETDLNSGAYDGFVIAPLQADLVANLISGQTAPIVAVDTDIDAPEVLAFVGTTNESAAKKGGEAAAELAEEYGWDEIKAICISGVQGDGTATARLTGYEEGVDGAGGDFLEDEIQYADAVADKAVNCMEAIIQNHPEGIALILGNNDDIAIAAARTAASYDAYANTVFVGFDGIQSACEAILSGEETMSVAQEAYNMGYKAVNAVVAALNGETIDEVIDSGCSIITAENAQARLEQLQGYLE